MSATKTEAVLDRLGNFNASAGSMAPFVVGEHVASALRQLDLMDLAARLDELVAESATLAQIKGMLAAAGHDEDDEDFGQ